MKLGKFIKVEKLKDQLSYIVKQSKGRKDGIGVLDDALVEPASEVITKLLTTYDEITEEFGEDQASSYGFNIMANYVMLSIQLSAVNTMLEKKIKEKENE